MKKLKFIRKSIVVLLFMMMLFGVRISSELTNDGIEVSIENLQEAKAYFFEWGWPQSQLVYWDDTIEVGDGCIQDIVTQYEAVTCHYLLGHCTSSFTEIQSRPASEVVCFD